MFTSLPFSTISYNTEAFLSFKLNQLVEERKINFWYYIYHKAEETEKKNHFHVYFIPNGKIQTDTVLDKFVEPDTLDKPPLKCTWAESSHHFRDRFLYDKHDEVYLASKNLVKKYHYKQSDFVTSDDEAFCTMIADIEDKSARIEIVKSYKSFKSLLESGNVPIQLVNQYRTVYDYVNEHVTDLRTGEVYKKSEFELLGKSILAQKMESMLK